MEFEIASKTEFEFEFQYELEPKFALDFEFDLEFKSEFAFEFALKFELAFTRQENYRGRHWKSLVEPPLPSSFVQTLLLETPRMAPGLVPGLVPGLEPLPGELGLIESPHFCCHGQWF